jgi:hypothetical protein
VIYKWVRGLQVKEKRIKLHLIKHAVDVGSTVIIGEKGFAQAVVLVELLS